VLRGNSQPVSSSAVVSAINLDSERQYKKQMKVWRLRKYKTSGMDGRSSVFSSEVDTDDNNVSMGTPEAAVDGGQGNWQLIGTMQEQLPSLGDTFALDPAGDSTASTSTSRAVGPPPSSAMWPHSELQQSYSMPMPQGLSDDQWLCQTHGGEMVSTQEAPALVTSSFANSYHELQSMGAVNNLDEDPLMLPGPVSRGCQQSQGNEDSFETIGSTPLSYRDIVNTGNFPRSP
jgi:hypothetical protein